MLYYSVSATSELFLCIAAFAEVTESRKRGELMFFSAICLDVCIDYSRIHPFIIL